MNQNRMPCFFEAVEVLEDGSYVFFPETAPCGAYRGSGRSGHRQPALVGHVGEIHDAILENAFESVRGAVEGAASGASELGGDAEEAAI